MRRIPAHGSCVSIVVCVVTCLAVCSPVIRQLCADDSLPRVPDGFRVQRAAAAPLVSHPMMGGFDHRGRLFVASSAGLNLPAEELRKTLPNFIQMLEDTDGDGRFDKSTVFADRMTLPMGALWHEGALYVASPPSIWRLEDTDDDGVADRRDEIVNMFGFSGNAASVHGCFLGPTGRIYWCDGRHGHDIRDAAGRVLSKGQAARIFSSRFDGSDVEVFCGGGMDNPVELDFTSEGEMLGTVNILLSNPREDCLMHWVDGGVYPRHDQPLMIAEFPRTGELLTPTAKLGHVAVSGMTRYRSSQFGPEFRDNVFVCIFNTGRVIRSELVRSGATFEARNEDFLVSDDPDFHPTDVVEDADGSLLVIDTGGWFRIGCPTSQIAKPEIAGAIYRIRREGAAVDDPRGESLSIDRMAPGELVAYLDDPRPVVRQRATERLVRLQDDALPALSRQLSAGSVEARRNVVWILSRMDGPPARSLLREALSDESPSVQQAALQSIGDCRDVDALSEVLPLLAHNAPSIRREAATAVGRIGDTEQDRLSPAQRAEAIQALCESLRTATSDRVGEHALILALIRMADCEQTRPYLKHSSPLVKRAALIALDQMQDGHLTPDDVVPLLDTDDPQLQQQAWQIISERQGWAGETVSRLKHWLAQPNLPEADRAMLRGVLLAQCRDSDIQQLTADTVQDSGMAVEMRLLLLEVLHRAVLDEFPGSWLSAVALALEDGDLHIRLQAVRIIQDRRLDAFDEPLRQLALDQDTPDQLRAEAVLAARPRMTVLEAKLFNFLIDRVAADIPPLERLTAARALADGRLDDPQLVRVAECLEIADPLTLPVLVGAFSQSASVEVGRALVARLQQTSAAASLSPDEIVRLIRLYPEEVQQMADSLLNRLSHDSEIRQERLEQLVPLLADGNAENGRAVFFGKKAACAGCHRVAGQGGLVGPDLTTIGQIRNGRDLVEAVAFPSASFARGFRPYSIATTDGRIHAGIIGRETSDSIYLRTADLAEIQIGRNDIEQMKESSTSIMPQGIDRVLTGDQLRDLLAYLQSLKP